MKRRILWRFAPLAALTAAALFLGVWFYSAAIAAGESDPAGELTEEEARALDYARAFGVDDDTATSRSNQLEAAKSTVSAIREEAGDIVAGIWLEHEPQLKVNLRLTEEPSAALKSMIDESPVPILVSTNAGATLDESVRRLGEVKLGLEQSLPDLQGTSIDERTGAIVLHVFIESGPNETERKARVEEAADSASRETGLPVQIEYWPAPLELQHTYGGTELEFPNGSDFCTGGFVVEYAATGAKGVTTAGHCDNSLTYIPFTTEADYSLSYVSQLLSSRVDAQWHVDSHPEYPEFYANSTTSRRTVTSVTERDDILVDAPICHRGNATGYSCGEIFSKTFAPTAECPVTTCDNTWILVFGGDESTLACYYGDSGGPWFYSFSAYGINTGGTNQSPDPGDCGYAVFMSQTYLSTDFGLDILVDN